MGPHAQAIALVHRAQAWLQAAAAHAPQARGTTFTRRCHDLRNHLGSLQAALDVLDVYAAGSATAAEAEAVVRRQCADIERALDALQLEAPWAPR